MAQGRRRKKLLKAAGPGGVAKPGVQPRGTVPRSRATAPAAAAKPLRGGAAKAARSRGGGKTNPLKAGGLLSGLGGIGASKGKPRGRQKPSITRSDGGSTKGLLKRRRRARRER